MLTPAKAHRVVLLVLAVVVLLVVLLGLVRAGV